MSLENVVVGDKLFVSSGKAWYITTVARLTKTQVVCENKSRVGETHQTKFKKDGGLVGGGPWSYTQAVLFSEHTHGPIVEKHKLKIRVQRLKNKLITIEEAVTTHSDLIEQLENLLHDIDEVK